MFLLDGAGSIRRGEVAGNGDRHFARRGPLGATQERGLKADAVDRVIGVPKRGVEDATLAVADRQTSMCGA